MVNGSTKRSCVLCGLDRRELRPDGPIEPKCKSDGAHECGMDGSDGWVSRLDYVVQTFPLRATGVSLFLERSRDFPVARSCSSCTCLEYKTKTTSWLATFSSLQGRHLRDKKSYEPSTTPAPTGPLSISSHVRLRGLGALELASSA